ncbi:hypothetical protein [Microbacterium lacticum]
MGEAVFDRALRRGLAGDIATSIMFAVALVVAVVFPVVGYAALFLMFLVSPVAQLVWRVLPRR